jgi:RecB family endonuclease NucS
VIELKKDLSSDKVVGQTLRYIAWIKENEAGPDESVRGLIITKDQDEKLKYALKATQNMELMTYSAPQRSVDSGKLKSTENPCFLLCN